MRWDKGFSSQSYMSLVDPVTWKDISRIEITGGSIKLSDSGLRASAEIDCIRYDQQTERYIRIWMDTKQQGSSGHEALFTGLATAPEREIDGNLEKNSLTCYSVLKPAQDVLLPLGFYAPVGIDGGQLVKQLLSPAIPAPISVTGQLPALSNYIIAEGNESRLSMAEKVLSAINGRIRISGLGQVEICPMASSLSLVFDPINNDVVEPQLKATNDWYDCPNVFRAVMDDTSAVARDDSLTSPLSTVNRGREVWVEERDCDLADNETLAEYANRRLKEEQRHYLSLSYERRFFPGVFPSDLIGLNYPAQKIVGSFYITEQSITLGYGAKISEEVIQV